MEELEETLSDTLRLANVVRGSEKLPGASIPGHPSVGRHGGAREAIRCRKSLRKFDSRSSFCPLRLTPPPPPLPPPPPPCHTVALPSPTPAHVVLGVTGVGLVGQIFTLICIFEKQAKGACQVPRLLAAPSPPPPPTLRLKELKDDGSVLPYGPSLAAAQRAPRGPVLTIWFPAAQMARRLIWSVV
ncbi:hypothetical protein E2C01_027057 [Portunus trituberculatus]|uniref:Uncharacterized protein n=1 Tax=Portunus trituberculatus TaxID=210409 RepID=A0A5B7EK53_PORTR|nr:hypothetical protein [Portunus trituberculatus]